MIFCHPPLPPPAPPFFSFSSSISASSSCTSLNFGPLVWLMGYQGEGYTVRTVVAFVNDICYCPFFLICKTIIQDSRFNSVILQPNKDWIMELINVSHPWYVVTAQKRAATRISLWKRVKFQQQFCKKHKKICEKYVSAEWGFHMHQFMLHMNFYCYKGLEKSYFPLQVIGHCATWYK